MLAVCRTCLRQITHTNFINLYDKDSSEIKKKLSACVPELELVLVKNAVLCISCANSLHLAYSFKEQCLSTEQRVRRYMSKYNTNTVSLVDVFKNAEQPHLKIKNEGLEANRAFSANSVIATELCSLLDEAIQDRHENLSKDAIMLDEDDDVIEINREEPVYLIEDSPQNEDYVMEDDYNLDKKLNVEEPSDSQNGNTNLHVCSNNETIARQDKSDQYLEVTCLSTQSSGHQSSQHSFDDSLTNPYVNSLSVHACDICGFETTTTDFLEKHLLQIHTVSSCESTGNPKSNSLACSACSYIAGNKASLKLHLQTHEVSGVYSCNICNKQLRTKRGLKTHTWVHIDKPPLCCQFCKYKCRSHIVLKLHVKKVHSEDEK